MAEISPVQAVDVSVSSHGPVCVYDQHPSAAKITQFCLCDLLSIAYVFI
jgi:hypothetical protein